MAATGAKRSALSENVNEFAPRQVAEGADGVPAQRRGFDRGPRQGGGHLFPQVGLQANVDPDAIRQEAFQQGYAEGEQAGLARATERLRAAVASWGRSALELAALKPGLRAEAEQELVELAFAISRRIVRRELGVDPATVLAIVRACLEDFDRAEMRRVSVNPQDLALVSEFFEKHPIRGLELVADPKVERGGALFHTAQGQLDARIETQLQEIEHGLADH